MPDLISSITAFGASSLSGLSVFHTTFQILLSTDSTGTKMVDVTALFPNPLELLYFRYEDHIAFQADNLELIVSDIGDRVINSKQVVQGNWLQIIIHQWNKTYPGEHVAKDIGTMQIDQIEQVWPPTQTCVMATSVPISISIKYTQKNEMNFTTDLKTYGQKVATEQGLAYSWQVPDYKDPSLNTLNIWNETDLQYLSRLCKSHGFAMHIKNKTLIIFDEQTAENAAPVYTIDFSKPGAGINLEHGRLTTQSQDIYSQAFVSLYDPDSGDTTEGGAKAPDIGSPATGVGQSVIYKRFDAVNPPAKTEQEEISGGTP
jgi:hypothetical protein